MVMYVLMNRIDMYATGASLANLYIFNEVSTKNGVKMYTHMYKYMLARTCIYTYKYACTHACTDIVSI